MINIIVYLSISLQVGILYACPGGWVTSNKNCYKFVTNVTRTWSDAAGDCTASGSHLVHINSAQENGFVVSELKTLLVNADIRHSAVWIGASDNRKEGYWVWYDNKEPILEYTNWDIGEPDTGAGDHEEDCACMAGSEDFRWQDRRCSEKLMYICEVPDGSGSNTPQVDHSGTKGCDSGWTLHGDSCYKFKTGGHDRVDWKHANDYCIKHNSHLVLIETRDEDQYLTNELGSLIETDHSNVATGVWVGGTDADHEGKWVWHDTVNNRDTPISGYMHWHHGEPDSGDGAKDEDCLCLIGSKGFDWQDYQCSTNMFFVCEKPASLTDAGNILG